MLYICADAVYQFFWCVVTVATAAYPYQGPIIVEVSSTGSYGDFAIVLYCTMVMQIYIITFYIMYRLD